jgi:hypothetical protein
VCVRWNLSFKLSFRDLVAIIGERGIIMTHTTILRWVRHYTRVREALAAVRPDCRRVVAHRRNLHPSGVARRKRQNPATGCECGQGFEGRMDVPVPCGRQSRPDCRFLPEPVRDGVGVQRDLGRHPLAIMASAERSTRHNPGVGITPQMPLAAFVALLSIARPPSSP